LDGGESAHDHQRGLGRDEGLEDGGCGSTEEEAGDDRHDLLGALLTVLLGQKGGFRVSAFKDGLDIVGAEGGESAQDAGVDKVDEGVELLRKRRGAEGREEGREGGKGRGDGGFVVRQVSCCSLPPSFHASLPPNRSAPASP